MKNRLSNSDVGFLALNRFVLGQIYTVISHCLTQTHTYAHNYELKWKVQ